MRYKKNGELLKISLKKSKITMCYCNLRFLEKFFLKSFCFQILAFPTRNITLTDSKYFYIFIL